MIFIHLSGHKTPEIIKLRQCFVVMILAGFLNIPEYIYWYLTDERKCSHSQYQQTSQKQFYLFYTTAMRYTIHLGKRLHI